MGKQCVASDVNRCQLIHWPLALALLLLGNTINFFPRGFQENVSPTVSVALSASGVIWFILSILRQEQKKFNRSDIPLKDEENRSNNSFNSDQDSGNVLLKNEDIPCETERCNSEISVKQSNNDIPRWARYVIMVGLIFSFLLILIFLNVRNIIESAFDNDTITSWNICYYFLKDPLYEPGCTLDAATFVIRLFYGIPVSVLSIVYCIWMTKAVKRYPEIYCSSVYFIKTAMDIMIWVQSLVDSPNIACIFMFAPNWCDENVTKIKKTYGKTNKANVRSLTYFLTFGLGIVIIPLGIKTMIYPEPFVEWMFILLVFIVSSLSPMASGAITVYMTVQLLNISNVVEGCLIVMFVVHGSSVVQLLATYFYPSLLIPIINDAIQSDDLFMRNMYGLTGACHDLIKSKNRTYSDTIYSYFKVCYAGYMISWTGDTMYSVATAALMHEYGHFLLALLVCLIKDLCVMCLPITLYFFSAFPSPATLTASLLAYVFTSGLSPLVSRIFTEKGLYVIFENNKDSSKDALVPSKVDSQKVEEIFEESGSECMSREGTDPLQVEKKITSQEEAHITVDITQETCQETFDHVRRNSSEHQRQSMLKEDHQENLNEQQDLIDLKGTTDVKTMWATRVEWRTKNAGFLNKFFFGISVVSAILPLASLPMLVMGLIIALTYVKHANLPPLNQDDTQHCAEEVLASQLHNNVSVAKFPEERKPVTWKMNLYLFVLFIITLIFLFILFLPQDKREQVAVKGLYTGSAMIVYMLQVFVIRYDFLESTNKYDPSNLIKKYEYVRNDF